MVLELKIGEYYVRVADGLKYKVSHEDSLCFYLCRFDGSCSKIVSVSKKHGKFLDNFVFSREAYLKIKISMAKEELASWRDTLDNYEETAK